MKRFIVLTVLCTALLAGTPGFAQDVPPPTDPNAGAYDALSPGNQKIVNAIYDSHIEATANAPTDSTTEGAAVAVEPLTPDDIAAMKADGGWGKTYKQLYAEGKVSYKNLGQAISAYNRSMRVPADGTPTVVTTGNGQQITTGDKKGGTTGSASTKSAGQGGGKKVGHMKSTVVTTGGGGAAVAGAGTASNAGGVSGFTGAGGAKGRGQGGASHKVK